MKRAGGGTASHARSTRAIVRLRTMVSIAIGLVMSLFLYALGQMPIVATETVSRQQIDPGTATQSKPAIIVPEILLPQRDKTADVPVPADKTDPGVKATQQVPISDQSTAAHLPPAPSTTIPADLLREGLKRRARGVFVEAGSSVNETMARLVSSFMDPLKAVPSVRIQPRSLIKAQQADPALKNNTALVQISNNTPTFTIHFTPPNRHLRYPSLKAAITELCLRSKVPDVTFLVLLNDGFRPSVPLFGSARHWSSWGSLIPVPLGNDRGKDQGTGASIVGWDEYVQQHLSSLRYRIPWQEKKQKAVFRGNYAPQKQVVGSCTSSGICAFPKTWREVNRGKLYDVASKRPDLFDVGFSSIDQRTREVMSADNVQVSERLSLEEQQAYKYVINVGSNQDWAERLRHSLFSDMAVIRHEAETQEFFYPLLKPYVHYIPVDTTLDNLVQVTEWAKAHDAAAEEISRNAYEFANTYITEKAMFEYWRVALTNFAAMQSQ